MHPLAKLLLKVCAIGLAVLMLPVLGLTLLSYSNDGLCSNLLLNEVMSPDGYWKAVVFERNCGATTGFVTHVSIIQASGDLPGGGGNVFVADTDHDRAPAGSGGGPEIRVAWSSPSVLHVGHHPLVRIFRAESIFQGIHVEYGE